MDRRKNQIFFSLLHSAICGIAPDPGMQKEITPEDVIDFLHLGKRHRVEHLVALALKESGFFPEKKALFEKEIFRAVYLQEQMDGEYQVLCRALEEREIDFLPLKGAVLRAHYPQGFMRSSCDIDILIKETDVDRAADLLVKEHGYALQGKGRHDVSLYSPKKLHLELHYTLLETAEDTADPFGEVLNRVWEVAEKKEGWKYFYQMPDALFYFYHIVHMARHFEKGGCGVRSFLDLFILDGVEDKDTSARRALLAETGLDTFAAAVEKMSRVWFCGEMPDQIDRRMENYILRGGVHGDNENRIVLQQQMAGGKMRYVLSKVFLPYDVIKFHYPVLKKHPFLLPVMQVRRWGKLLFSGERSRVMAELEKNATLSSRQGETARQFLQDIGLMKK